MCHSGTFTLKTLAVLSRKGGTGKTTVALHLAVAAQRAGRPAVMADLDRQHSLIEWRRRRPTSGIEVAECKAGALFTLQQSASRAADLLIVDTGPASDETTDHAVRCADLCLIVVRPCFFDIHAVAESAELVKRMGRPGLLVLNQAPSRRNGVEMRSVGEAVRALKPLGLPISPIGLRSRAAYQHAEANGLAAQEMDPDSAASAEIGALWRHVEGLLWPAAELQARSTAWPFQRAEAMAAGMSAE
jgi:chromosome partitioning protein